jgi:CheY-like chemotaxis protein
VVDNHREDREALTALLSFYGPPQIRVAEHGIQALSEVCRRHPTCIFLNLLMPGMDGFTVATMIRNYERTLRRRACIVALSSMQTAAIESYCFEADIDGCLAKPVCRRELDRILRLLGIAWR